MKKIERMALSDMLDRHFCLLEFTPIRGERVPENRVYRNRDYRTLGLQVTTNRNKRSVRNLLEVRNREVISDLMFRYPDNCHPVVRTLVERHLGAISFPWADICEGARSFVVDTAAVGLSPAKFARWMERSFEHPALALEGQRFVRVSTSHENDFVLLRMKF